MGSGPVTGLGTFHNKQQIPIIPVYRDPVHDFGFFEFDPRLIHQKLEAIELAPENAAVGIEIRVVGNDAAEKLSISSGTLARLDRTAPSYGPTSFNDFNTFYYQASSGTVGGSSGSPVVDITGKAVALNAAGKKGASQGFYLPLDRVARALWYVQRKQDVPRGTIQTTFRHRPYHIARKLGLNDTSHKDLADRFENQSASPSTITGTGMLVVNDVVPGGPAAGVLETGDVLLEVDGKTIDTFIPLEEIIDASVGKALSFKISRRGEEITRQINVGDLHAITPDEILQVGGATLNELSYHQARNYGIPVGGVFVASSGFMLADLPTSCVVTYLNNKPVRSLRVPVITRVFMLVTCTLY